MIALRNLLLLAQRSVWENLGLHFSGEHRELQTEDLVAASLLAGGFALGFFLLWRAQRLVERKPARRSPKRLASELAAAHRLSYRERLVCRAAAEELSLEEPAELYVRPECRVTVARRDAKLADRLYESSTEAPLDQGEKR